jgi:acyl dehydratase
MSNRFTQPVFPGETLKFEFFEEGGLVRYRGTIIERDTVVLDRGTATFR